MFDLSLIIKNNDLFGEVTFLQDENRILFKANDVLKVLGYAEGNWRTTISRKCNGVTKCNVGVITEKKKDGSNAIQNIEMNFITEGDVYRLIISSKLPTAVKFESWIFDEVIPQIRKTGGYIPIVPTETDEELMARALLLATNTIALRDKMLKDIKLSYQQSTQGNLV